MQNDMAQDVKTQDSRAQDARYKSDECRMEIFGWMEVPTDGSSTNESLWTKVQQTKIWRTKIRRTKIQRTEVWRTEIRGQKSNGRKFDERMFMDENRHCNIEGHNITKRPWTPQWWPMVTWNYNNASSDCCNIASSRHCYNSCCYSAVATSVVTMLQHNYNRRRNNTASLRHCCSTHHGNAASLQHCCSTHQGNAAPAHMVVVLLQHTSLRHCYSTHRSSVIATQVTIALL